MLTVAPPPEFPDDQSPDPGDDQFKKIYAQLRALAAKIMRGERPDHTLQPTALVNEAYLRLLRNAKMKFESHAHFMAFMATVIRNVLVDHARRARAAKRPGRKQRVEMDSGVAATPEFSVSTLDLDRALKELAKLDPQAARIVEMKYYGGMTLDEIAEVLKISRRTVARDWDFARTWLRNKLKPKDQPPVDPADAAVDPPDDDPADDNPAPPPDDV